MLRPIFFNFRIRINKIPPDISADNGQGGLTTAGHPDEHDVLLDVVLSLAGILLSCCRIFFYIRLYFTTLYKSCATWANSLSINFSSNRRFQPDFFSCHRLSHVPCITRLRLVLPGLARRSSSVSAGL